MQGGSGISCRGAHAKDEAFSHFVESQQKTLDDCHFAGGGARVGGGGERAGRGNYSLQSGLLAFLEEGTIILDLKQNASPLSTFMIVRVKE